MVSKLKKLAIGIASTTIGLYALFLLSPLVITPILNTKTDIVNDFITKSTGLDAKIKGFSLVTAWNFSAGIKVKEISLSIPKSEKPFLYAQNTGIKLSLLPILNKDVQLDCLFSDGIYADIVLKPDGSPLLLDYLPKNDDKSSETFELPAGLKLSNKLPSVYIKDYRIAVIDGKTSSSYFMEGEDFKVSNFVLDKHFKFSTKGKFVFDKTPISYFDIKIDNHIMPNVQLQDLVFPPEIKVAEEDEKQKQPDKLPENIQAFNIIEILNSIKDNQLSGNITANIKTKGTLKAPQIDGYFKIDKLTVAVDKKQLPESFLEMKFKGNKTNINSNFYTSTDKSEITALNGEIKSGKKSSLDLAFKSNAKFKNIIDLIDSIASSFGIKDFNTLSATGGIDADFNIKSDFKKVTSNGYLKVVPSSLTYGLYNVKIDNISANIDLNDNNIDIKNAGFSIFGQPLKLTGSILSDTTTDLILNADKLSLKGLLTACAQLSILKENNINSGVISAQAVLKGKLKEIQPKLNATIQNINIYNKPTQAKITLNKALADFIYDGKAASGKIDINAFGINYAGSKVTIPKALIDITPDIIKINNSYVMLNNSKVDITGSIKDYLNDKMAIDIVADGNLQSAGIASFLPKEFTKLISYKGQLPIRATLKGNSNIQNIVVDLSANPNNYIALVDVAALKGKTTKIHSNIEIIGDELNLSNTTVSNGISNLAIASGGISKLYTKPKLNINIAVPNAISFPIWGLKNSNVTADGNVTVVGDIMNPNMRGTVNLMDISDKDMDFALTDMVADLSGPILNGSATARQFRFGGIVATDLIGNFSLKNYSTFYLTDTSAKSFDGHVNGKLSYDIPTTKIGVEFTGNGLNSTKAVEGAIGIKKALTGTMGFKGKLTMQGVTDKEIIRSMKGNLNFNVNDGRFISIGKLENIVAAQNITSNSIFKAAISALATLSTVQEADRFKTITGDMTFSNGTASISKMEISGPSMSYHVKGTYNIIPNTASLIILGRLEAKVVSVLGPLGQLSAEKLLSYIPQIGPATAQWLKLLTSNPENEDISLIPPLSSGSTTYKDFKVTFNGPVEGATSVKSFKWLSKCDTTEMNLKLDLENAKQAVKDNINNRVEEAKTKAENVHKNVTNAVENQKKQIEQTKKDIEQTKTDLQNAKNNAKQSADNLKNLFQNALKNSQNKIQEPAAEKEEPAKTESTQPEAEKPVENNSSTSE